MGFNNLFFLFLFLPVSLIIYKFIHEKYKDLLLIILSIVFYAWGGVKDLIFLMLIICFNFIAGVEISVTKENKRIRKYKRFGMDRKKRLLVTTVFFDVAFLAFFKYISGTMPLGVSFYMFTVLSFIFDIYYGKENVLNENGNVSFKSFVLFTMFFPKVAMGPIVRFTDFCKQLKERTINKDDYFEGFQKFLIGLMKKVVLADNLGIAFSAFTGAEGLFEINAASVTASVLGAWLGMICYGLQLYFDFSGYSDMAIGIARMFGFRFAENFDYPYMSKSVAEFWRRWHISLGNWFKNYVYFPLGGSKVDKLLILRNLAFVWILTGVWHGNTWNFILWGIYHGIFVIFDHFTKGTVVDKCPKYVRGILTVLEVFVGWIFFFAPGAKSAFTYMSRLFGSGDIPFVNSECLYYLGSYVLLITVSAFGCTDIPKKLVNKYLLNGKVPEKAVKIILAVVQLVMIAAVIALLIGNTNTTFMYAKF